MSTATLLVVSGDGFSPPSPRFSVGDSQSSTLAKRDNESVHQAYARIVNSNVEIRRALLKSDVPNRMDVEPVFVGGSDATDVSSDSSKAIRQLQELAAKQHKTFEQVFADPANGALARGTYTSAHRPNICSPGANSRRPDATMGVVSIRPPTFDL
jgi:hypothetical protein